MKTQDTQAKQEAMYNFTVIIILIILIFYNYSNDYSYFVSSYLMKKQR